MVRRRRPDHHALASTLNLAAHDTRPSLAIVKIGTNGQISLSNNAGTVNVAADIVGYCT